jgi:NTE family protein
MLQKEPVGLALEGGGGKGAYQIGAWRALVESGFSFGAISGMSIGAINGAFISLGDEKAAGAFWMRLSEIRRARIDPKKAKGFLLRLLTDLCLVILPVPAGKWRLLKFAKATALLYKGLSNGGGFKYLLRKGLIDTDVMAEMLFEYLDVERLSTSDIDLYISIYKERVLYPFFRGKSILKRAQDLDPHSLKAFLMASAALPLLFPIVEIDRRRYRDGQLGVPNIHQPLVDLGLKRIFVVHLRPWDKRNRKRGWAEGVVHIAPEVRMGGLFKGTLDFDPVRIETRIKMGYEDTLRILDSIDS